MTFHFIICTLACARFYINILLGKRVRVLFKFLISVYILQTQTWYNHEPFTRLHVMYKISIKNANNNFKFDELCNGCLYRGIGINIGIGIIKYSPNNYYITTKIRDLYNALQEKQKSKKICLLQYA